MAKTNKPTVEEIIRQAVAAQRIVSERQSQDVFKATEKRLYAYPIIKLKVNDILEEIDELEKYGVREKSKSIVMYQTSGSRLTYDEIIEAKKIDLNAQIAANERELETIEKALMVIDKDQYKNVVCLKYFEGKDDSEIAKLIPCDPSTVRRNKSRLVGRLAVYLYGVTAIV